MEQGQRRGRGGILGPSNHTGPQWKEEIEAPQTRNCISLNWMTQTKVKLPRSSGNWSLACPLRACVAEFSLLPPHLWWRWEEGAFGRGVSWVCSHSTGVSGRPGPLSPQHVDMNSSRNLFVFGFSIYCGLTIPNWVSKNPDLLQTGDSPASGL